MQPRRRAWLINLDAEVEIEGWAASGHAPTDYDPWRAFERHGRNLASAFTQLVPAGDTILRRGDGWKGEAVEGHAWSMTPRARAALEAAGARPVRAPNVDVIIRAMSRELCATLPRDSSMDDATLPRAFVRAAPDLHRVNGLDPGPSGAWLARTAFGFTGRGRRILTHLPPTDPAEIAFLERAFAKGGVLITPLVQPTRDFALHGYLHDGGEVVFGEPTVSDVNRGGVWQASRRATAAELAPDERTALQMNASRAAATLHTIGYWGPFGIDAFRYESARVSGFCAMCEINARYTMGWGIGMGDRRPDLDRTPTAAPNGSAT